MLRVFCGGILCAAVTLVGCGAGVFDPIGPVVPSANGSPIQHVVIIMQENRTVDNLFNGFPGADTAQSGMSDGVSVPLQPIHLNDPRGLDNSHPNWWHSWNNGKLDGFAKGRTTDPLFPYSFVPQSDVLPYWNLASRFTFGDRMFQSNTGPSFIAHQYMIAAQSGNASGNPGSAVWGCDASASTRVALIGPNGTELPGVYPASTTPPSPTSSMPRASAGATTPPAKATASSSSPPSRPSATFASAPTGPPTSSHRRQGS